MYLSLSLCLSSSLSFCWSGHVSFITLIKCLKGQKSQRSLFEGGVWLLWWWYTYIYKTGNSFAFFHKCNYNYMENTIAICNPCVSGWKDSFHLKPPSRENVNYLLSLKTELRMVLPKTNTLLIALICGGLPSILDKQNNSQKLVSPLTSWLPPIHPHHCWSLQNAQVPSLLLFTLLAVLDWTDDDTW